MGFRGYGGQINATEINFTNFDLQVNRIPQIPKLQIL